MRFNLVCWTRGYCGIARHCGLPYDTPKGTLLLCTAPNHITRLCTISLNCSHACKQFSTSHCAAPRKGEKMWSSLLPAQFIVPDNACLLFSRFLPYAYQVNSLLELVRKLVAHGDAREGKWRGNWRMEWVASTLTPSPNVVCPALLKLMRTPRLPAVDWTKAPTDLNGLVRFGETRNLVSARVASRSARAIPINTTNHYTRASGV